jgi:hypothetical protein
MPEKSSSGASTAPKIKEVKMRVAEQLGHGRPEVTDIYLHGGK